MVLRSHPPEPPNPGFHYLKTEVVDLTPDLAERHRDMEASATERELSTRRINYLTYKIENGLFLTPTWIIAQRPDGTKVRMNGQHTSTAVSALNGSWPGGKVMIETYKVDGPEGEALLFRQIDARQSGRSPADVAGAYQGQQAELLETARRTAKLAVEGYVWQHRRVRRLPTPRGDDRYQLMTDPKVKPFIIWLGEIFTGKTPEMRREPIVAAMYASWESNKGEATTFWREVAKGNYDEDSKEPAHVLSNWLLGEYTEPSGLQPDEYYQGATYAWNQHRSGKEITSVKYAIRNGRFSDTAD